MCIAVSQALTRVESVTYPMSRTSHSYRLLSSTSPACKLDLSFTSKLQMAEDTCTDLLRNLLLDVW